MGAMFAIALLAAFKEKSFALNLNIGCSNQAHVLR